MTRAGMPSAVPAPRSVFATAYASVTFFASPRCRTAVLLQSSLQVAECPASYVRSHAIEWRANQVCRVIGGRC